MIDLRQLRVNQNGMREFYSNCFLEAIKAKIRYGKEVELIFIRARDNDVYCPHWLWYDKRDGNVKDFHGVHVEHLLLFKGYIRQRPKKVFDKWRVRCE